MTKEIKDSLSKYDIDDEFMSEIESAIKFNKK